MWTDRRALGTVVAASLLLNVFLSGAVLGRFFGEKGRTTEPPQIAAGSLVGPGHVKALPPGERRLFHAAMAPHRPTIREAREAHRAARRRIEADIAAPTYDKGRVAADFEALRQTSRVAEEAVDAALLDALAVLPPGSRAALVSHVREPQVAAPGTPPPR